MIDYWLSFATSLDPNDGLGLPRKSFIDLFIDDPPLLRCVLLLGPKWAQYTPQNEVRFSLFFSFIFLSF